MAPLGILAKRTAEREKQRSHNCWLWVGLAMVTLSFCVFAHPQSASEYQVKAAYLYNFAKATEWPSEVLPRTDSAMILCVFGGGDDFVRLLRSTLGSKMINGHPLEVKHLRSPDELRSCHMVFFRASEPNTGAALASLAGASVLLVGEDTNFLAQGGMINLVLRSGRVTFEVNPAAMERNGVRYGTTRAPSAPQSNSVVERAGARPVKSQASPEYPDIAKSMNLRGIVQLQVVVRADGTVKEVHVVGGHPMLAAAAEQAVMKWRYQPAAKETIETVKIAFGQ
jgi:TonB family protein